MPSGLTRTGASHGERSDLPNSLSPGSPHQQSASQKRKSITNALTDGAAIISIRLTNGDQRPNSRLLWVVATSKDGDWRLLFQRLSAHPRELPGIRCRRIRSFHIRISITRSLLRRGMRFAPHPSRCPRILVSFLFAHDLLTF